MFERGERKPTLEQLLRLAQALALPVQWFLTGATQPGGELKETAVELFHLGLVDLHVGERTVPGSFRPPELVVALAVCVPRPEPRLLAAIPALLAWNRWNPILLEGFGADPWHGVPGGPAPPGRSRVQRLAWLADVALTIHRSRGFPGGCPGEEDLCAFLRRVPDPDAIDDLGELTTEEPRLPAWKRWKITGRAGGLDHFYDRAAELLTLRGA